jgi:hypothetical protein
MDFNEIHTFVLPHAPPQGLVASAPMQQFCASVGHSQTSSLSWAMLETVGAATVGVATVEAAMMVGNPPFET